MGETPLFAGTISLSTSPYYMPTSGSCSVHGSGINYATSPIQNSIYSDATSSSVTQDSSGSIFGPIGNGIASFGSALWDGTKAVGGAIGDFGIATGEVAWDSAKAVGRGTGKVIGGAFNCVGNILEFCGDLLGGIGVGYGFGAGFGMGYGLGAVGFPYTFPGFYGGCYPPAFVGFGACRPLPPPVRLAGPVFPVGGVVPHTRYIPNWGACMPRPRF